MNSKEHEKVRHGFGLRVKFLGILFMLFLLFAANIIITNSIIGAQKQDALLINLAGRQRMISQRILRLAGQLLLYGSGASGETSGKNMMSSKRLTKPLSEKKADKGKKTAIRIRRELEDEVTLFEMTHNALLEGGKTLDSVGRIVYLQKNKSKKNQKALEEIYQKWHMLIKNVYSLIMNDSSSDESVEAVTLAFKKIEEIGLLSSLNQMVSILEQEAQERIKLLHNIQMMTLPLGVFIFFIALVYLQISILKPIKHLVNTVMMIGQGDTKKRVSVKSNGEIGFLADSFNQMMDNLEQTTVSMDFLESVVNAICESLIVTNRDREIVLANPAARDILGIKRDQDIIGKKIDQFAVHSGKKENRSLLNGQTFERLLKYGFIKDYNVSYQGKGGDIIPVSFSARTLTDSVGGFEGLVCVAKDMREYNMLQSQLIQSSKLAALGTMSAGMAHELKNPLTIVRGKAQFILHQIEEGKKPEHEFLMKNMNDIVTSADRMTIIIDHLKDFSREPNEKDWKHLDIKQVIDDSLLLLKKELEKKNIAITLEIEDDLPALWGDQNKLISVFQNLVANAADAFEDINDSREKFVKISASLINGTQINIIVEDNGSGMEKDVLENIFNPFFTTKPIGKGTGLGLSILYGIIEEHNGTVDVNSEPGKGTVFEINFPADDITQKILHDEKKE